MTLKHYCSGFYGGPNEVLGEQGKNTEGLGARKGSVQKDLGFLFHLYQEAQTLWQGCPHKQRVKKWGRFPQIKPEYHFRETSLLQEEVVQQQKIKVIQLSLLGDSPHVLGGIHKQYNNWEQLTSDKLILSIIKEGITIDFHTLPRCPCAHSICHLNPTQQEAITEVQHLLSLSLLV